MNKAKDFLRKNEWVVVAIFVLAFISLQESQIIAILQTCPPGGGLQTAIRLVVLFTSEAQIRESLFYVSMFFSMW